MRAFSLVFRAARKAFAPPRDRKSEAGFTLIEAVTALGVFAIAAISLMQLSGQNVRAQTGVRDALFAGIVAENRMVEIMADPDPLQAGSASGEVEQVGRRWTWTSSITPTERPNVMQIEVEVRDDSDPPRLIASVIGFRRAQ